MRRFNLFLLAGGLGLLALIPAGAQPFHEIYGRTFQFGELTSVSATRSPGAIASGSFIDGLPQGVLLKILSTGKLDWTKAYGPTQISAVRETPAGGFAWIGTGEVAEPRGSAPVVAGVDSSGAVQWSQRILLVLPDGAPALLSQGLFLEIDPKDGGYWVGGNVWVRELDDPHPWMGKLDKAGKLLWAKTLATPYNARIFSIFPALDGGILGVGQAWAPKFGEIVSWMLAVKLGAGGDLVWQSLERTYNSESTSAQWLTDLDRDPRSTRPESVVVGTVIDFCPDIPSRPCYPEKPALGSAAFVATLDETNGRLGTNAFGLFSTSQPKTLGETVVTDLLGETNVVGGEIAGEGAGARKGFLALLNLGTSFLRQATIHGAGAGFDGTLRSLDRWTGDTSPGYLFTLNETYGAPRTVPTWLRSVVRTDRNGNSGACEQCTELQTFQAWLYGGTLQIKLLSGKAEPFPVKAAPFTLEQAPCRGSSCKAPSPEGR